MIMIKMYSITKILDNMRPLVSLMVTFIFWGDFAVLNFPRSIVLSPKFPKKKFFDVSSRAHALTELHWRWLSEKGRRHRVVYRPKRSIGGSCYNFPRYTLNPMKPPSLFNLITGSPKNVFVSAPSFLYGPQLN